MSALTNDLRKLTETAERAAVKEGGFRQKLHLMPPVGWLNDPNGLCQLGGVFHAFFQYSPFDPEGGVKLWGHYTSRNMLDWEYKGAPIYPDQPFDCSGVYSGCAYIEDGEMYLYYTGNVKLEMTRINFQELINQTNGEFSEKFEDKGLQFVVNLPEEPVVIEADGRRLWRIIENLYNNAAKYAMPHTRVYVDLTTVGHMARFSIKNISEQPLNIGADELTERFIRGDVARSTEGSGLGLSIAKNLTELQKGSFDIYLDGDLFKVTIIFPEAPEPAGKAQEQ